ncbi:MAG: RNA polymerase sporulation sigma factor SigH [Clostridia bacterium]
MEQAGSTLAQLSDEELVVRSRYGEIEQSSEASELLCERYKNIVRMKARPYFLMGADHEDLVQEGMIGLYKAIRDYDDGHGASFRSFAEMCILRQIITAIKSATRQKHAPLNTYVSLYRPMYDEDADRTLMDVFTLSTDDPEDTFIGKESLNDIAHYMNALLSPLEKRVVYLFLDGKSYQEISTELGRGTKTVDNALQRVKHKLEQYVR